MADLHDEIVEAQKQRGDLLRWKLILVAAISMVGFGLGGTGQGHAPWVLGTIPFVCAYVDALYVHLALRIMVIGAYRRKHKNDLQEYELFAHRLGSTFRLESVTAIASSAVADGVLLVHLCRDDAAAPHRRELVLAAVAGIAVTLAVVIYFFWARRKIEPKERIPSPPLLEVGAVAPAAAQQNSE